MPKLVDSWLPYQHTDRNAGSLTWLSDFLEVSMVFITTAPTCGQRVAFPSGLRAASQSTGILCAALLIFRGLVLLIPWGAVCLQA